MWYVISGIDTDNSLAARLQARPAHIARLKLLESEQRLLVAGPCPADSEEEAYLGSVIIAKFETLSDAETWAKKDPYIDAGVYQSVTVKAFKPVLGKLS